MTDPGTLALGIAAISMLISTIALIRRDGAKSALTAAMCPCEHGINFHVDNGTGRCVVVIERVPTQWLMTPSGLSKATGWEIRECGCQMYAGPELLRGLTSGGFHLPEIREEKQ